MSELLNRDEVNSQELEELLKAREAGEADFLLVDVREQIEYDMGHIKGVDMLKPTSTFHSWAQAFLNEYKDRAVIFTCRTDYRSGNVHRVFKSNGMSKAINHVGGIVTYRGDIERG
ncbi:MAG: rhodanese-like domain-containing protein [Epsilonproteobacteria bacterium]|jgi:rhodanese-related sulfurtransferase|nr:rhodanese-like domain-containing protein [Campylobacterota bacterium]